MPGSLLVSPMVAAERGDEIRAIAPGHPLVVLGEQPLSKEQLATIELAYVSLDTFPERIAAFMGALRNAPALDWLQMFSGSARFLVCARSGTRRASPGTCTRSR